LCLFSSQASVDVGTSAGIVDVPLAQTGEGIAECELLKWFVKEASERMKWSLTKFWEMFVLILFSNHNVGVDLAGFKIVFLKDGNVIVVVVGRSSWRISTTVWSAEWQSDYWDNESL